MPVKPATKWNCIKRDRKGEGFLFLKVQKLLNKKFEISDASIEISGATSSAIPNIPSQ